MLLTMLGKHNYTLRFHSNSPPVSTLFRDATQAWDFNLVHYILNESLLYRVQLSFTLHSRFVFMYSFLQNVKTDYVEKIGINISNKLILVSVSQ